MIELNQKIIENMVIESFVPDRNSQAPSIRAKTEDVQVM
jgi:hypothetical protein